jgi:hypothetical protein
MDAITVDRKDATEGQLNPLAQLDACVADTIGAPDIK